MKFPHLYILAFAFVAALAAVASYEHAARDHDRACARALGACGSAADCEPWARDCGWAP